MTQTKNPPAPDKAERAALCAEARKDIEEEKARTQEFMRESRGQIQQTKTRLDAMTRDMPDYLRVLIYALSPHHMLELKMEGMAAKSDKFIREMRGKLELLEWISDKIGGD